MDATELAIAAKVHVTAVNDVPGMSLSNTTTSLFEIVIDFMHGTDKIDLSAIDANTFKAHD